MARQRSLILSLIDKRPSVAARALNTMQAEDAAAFLEDIPTRYTTHVLSHMGAWSASGLLSRLSIAKAAAALGGFNYQSAAALLRLMAPETRKRILEQLPTAIQRDFSMTLSFPLDTVGAHMTTLIITQRMDHTVADAREHARKATKADTGCVIIVDASHRLAGVVPPASLLGATGNSMLTDIMDTDVEPVSARARIATAGDLEAWDRYLSLPVISRRKHIIGALQRVALRKVHAGRETVPQASQSLSLAIADAFIGYFSGLAHLLDGEPRRERDIEEIGS